MTLLEIVIALLVFGVIIYLLRFVKFIDDSVKAIIVGVIAIIFIIWLLQSTGVGNLRIGN